MNTDIHPPFTIVLASQSPRRHAYLRQLLGESTPFIVAPADLDEQFQAVSAEENARALSLEKARFVQAQYADAIIIASDTIVAVDDHQLAKPTDRADAERMLRQLAGQSTSVITGLAVLAPGRDIVTSQTTEVHFRSLVDPTVEAALQVYLDSGDWADKAGAYGIQSGAGPLIAGIKGDYSVVVGLPVTRLADILESEFGMSTQSVTDTIPEGIAVL